MGNGKLTFFLLYAFLLQFGLSSSLPHLCPNDQALALLQFKHMFTINPDAPPDCFLMSQGVLIDYSYPKTHFWNRSTDCCSWDGVFCDETTGQVIELNLTCSQLQGKFHSNSSVFNLSSLKRLGLSYNNFSGSHIFPQFGGFPSLTHLDLSDSGFSGQIPSEISHLSKLRVLRIWSSPQIFSGSPNFKMLLENLTQLRVLALPFVNISSPFPLNFSSYLTTLGLEDTQLYGILPKRVFHLSNLEILGLGYNPQLTVRFPITKWNSSKSLMRLDLSGMNVSGKIPESFRYLTSLLDLHMGSCSLMGPTSKLMWNFTHIETLDLSNNHLQGPISQFFKFGKIMSLSLGGNNFTGQLEFLPLNQSWTQLEKLDISSNSLTGPIPSNVSGLQNLQSLVLSSNSLNGTIPSWIFSLPSLEELYLTHNHFQGPISQFFKLGKLRLLFLTGNNFTGQLEFSSLNRSWTQLEKLDISSNSLTGPISSNVSGLQNLQSLYLSSNNLNGTIPSWIFSLPSLEALDLSDNHFSGNIQEFKSDGLSSIDLGDNQLKGPIPKSLLNKLQMGYLVLSHNNLSGQIASSICNLQETLMVLDLGSNNFSGTIPQCLGEMSNVTFLDLSNNSLSGTINTTFSIGNQLSVVNLYGNKLEGKVPRSLTNCKYLKLLDLHNNELNDTFPEWLGVLSNLKILILRSNKFHGHIKASKSRDLFARLQIMDLSFNEFSGNLPAILFENLQAMKIIDDNVGKTMYDGVIITTKGADREFVYVLPTNIVIDLSRNEFEGDIPSIIGDLIGLRTLNLSHNGLEGPIPTSIKRLSVLESLDLSFNKIAGGIPQQLASLTSLAVLNLSCNHLTGCIPRGGQFDTFENSSYQGNDGLRGFPVSRDCGDDGAAQAMTPIVLNQGEGEESSMISWQAVLIGYGCGLTIGLSIIYIMLSTLKPTWFARRFHELEHMIITRIQRHLKRN